MIRETNSAFGPPPEIPGPLNRRGRFIYDPGSLVAARRGVITAIPELEEIEALRASCKTL